MKISPGDEACKLLKSLDCVTKKHNLYERVRSNQKGIKTDLIQKIKSMNEIYDNSQIINNNDPPKEKKEEELVNVPQLIGFLKKDVYFDPLIQLITDKPFRLLYNWPEQLLLWRRCSQINLTIILGVSNYFVNVVNLKGRMSFYTLMAEVKEYPVPLYQMLFEKNNFEELVFFISEYYIYYIILYYYLFIILYYIYYIF